jgi:holo-[acyl-carrier protein] synthase
MIKGIGCDIISIERVGSLLNQYGDRFRKKIFTQYEISKEPQGNTSVAYYAKRLAAKEAFAKALGWGIGSEISFTDIEIANNERGAPFIICKKISHIKIHLSLSDEKQFAIAYVIVES